jgi:diguanylate cyclase (GGDEF)-like protein
MARDERQAVDVVRRGLTSVFGAKPLRLLLADTSQAHLELTRMGSDADGPSCAVDCPMDCPAARTGRSQVFAEPEAVDACPWLTGGQAVTCSPVSASGRVVGVVQVLGEALEPSSLTKLELIVREFGTRLSVLRAMSAAERAASRDPLTGLLNRRSLEERATPQLASHEQSAVVIVDIDHFKRLNDTYGHAVGDRALTVFARLLDDHFEGQGLVARYGGEEFLVVLPGVDAADAADRTEVLREQVANRCLAAGVPAVTASFGVADRRVGQDL